MRSFLSTWHYGPLVFLRDRPLMVMTRMVDKEMRDMGTDNSGEKDDRDYKIS